jgi:hypothetical protein
MTAQESNIERTLQPLCEYLEQELTKELISQGHVATGALRDSIKVAVKKTAYGAVIEGSSAFYARYVDWGRRQMVRRVPIDALLSWIRVKNIPLNGKKETSIAFAIQAAIYKRGIPTDRNVNKTAFVTKTLTGAQGRIKDDVSKAIGEFLAIDLNNIIRDAKDRLNGAYN